MEKKLEYKCSPYLLVGWAQIASHTPFSESTIRKKFKPAMIEAGVVFKSCLGRGKRPTWWTTESLLLRFLMEAREDNGEL
jgi:hypothetical protein